MESKNARTENGKRLKRDEDDGDDGVRGTDFLVIPFLVEQVPGIGTC